MNVKKYTQLQRIKTLEATTGMLWKIIKLQGDKLKELDEVKCGCKKKDGSKPTV